MGSRRHLAPEISEKLQAGDELIVEGRLDRIEEMNSWGQLLAEDSDSDEQGLQSFGMEVAKIGLAPDSPWIGKTISELGFRNSYGLNVLAVLRADEQIDHNVKLKQLREDDVLVVHGPRANLDRLSAEKGILPPVIMDGGDMEISHELGRNVRLLTVPANSHLLGLHGHREPPWGCA